MTRFQKLVAATLALTLALVIVGVVVRATGSGLGCPDWPFCYGQVIPPLEFKAWAEWIHRLIAAVIGVMVLGVAILAVVDHRDRRSLVAASFGAVALVVFQAWLGRETVRLGNSGASVTAHLAAAMAVAGLLTFLLVRAGYPARLPGRGGSQRFTILAAFAAVATFAMLIFGANVTAADAALIFPDWPLMGGAIVPPFGEMPGPDREPGLHPGAPPLRRGRRRAGPGGHLGRRLARPARRARRPHALPARHDRRRPVSAAGGGGRAPDLDAARPVDPDAPRGACRVHLGGRDRGDVRELLRGAGRRPRSPTSPRATPATGREAATPPRSRPLSGTIRAYVALTKPRIIELLLITTIPAMVLATRDLPGVDWIDWSWLVVCTLVGGTLAAGSANAINQYLDRDIDVLMTRTRRRPLPAHSVEPEAALVFGIVLGVISIAFLAYFVNVVAAFLTLLAIAFYVFVYTILLKRTTTQNIVIGGAAGALPPVIGWAAVTGRVEVPALLLFAIVFYWTPPHFWALSMRIAKDYAAAGVPMLPVVRGTAETTRQILLYTILLVLISLVFFAVAKMGLIYLVAAVVMGGIFLWQAAKLNRTVSVEGTTAGAIRLYKFSITYLTILFAAVAVDALVLIRIA